MYAIIYWVEENQVYPYLYSDGRQLKLFETWKEADQAALEFEGKNEDFDCRIISIDQVHE